MALYHYKDLATAQPLFEQALAIYRQLGDQHGIATALLNLADGLQAQNDDQWVLSVEQGLALFRDIGDIGNIAMCQLMLSDAPRLPGGSRDPGASLLEALASFAALGDQRHVGRCLGELAVLSWQRGRFDRAGQLFGAAEAIFATIGSDMHPEVRSRFDQAIAETRAKLGAAPFVAAWSRGQAMTMEQVIVCAAETTSSAR